MNNSFYERIWTHDMGPDYYQNFRWTPVFQRQEQAYRDYISKNLKDVKSVLELGIGFGRITKITLEELPNIISYVGVDISPDQINNAKKFLGEREKEVAFVQDNILEYKDTKSYDLVLASEILLHIRPQDIHKMIQKMAAWTNKDIIHIDWARNYQSSHWVFVHPYYNLFTEAGMDLVKEVQTDLQSIWHWRKL